jgi:hypothetical protein
MLDGGDAGTILDQRGGQAGVADILGARMQAYGLGKIGATKHDTGVDRCGTQRHVHLLT